MRIKVMQLLYAKGRDATLNLNDLVRRYENYGVKTQELYLFNLHQVSEIARYAIKDAVNRRAKLLPTAEDKIFEPTIFQNEVLQSLVKDRLYQQTLQKFVIINRTDEDTTRNYYNDWLKTEAYQNYLALPTAIESDHRDILVALYRFLAQHETFNEDMEDKFISWIDDKTLITAAVKKTLKSLPDSKDFVHEMKGEDLLTYQFGDELLLQTAQHDETLLADIKPMLQNWDAERVTAVDMVLIKMALAELLYFPTIPTKVTINEYVDISKLYSTDKSKEFINGILDRLMKKLHTEARIQKEGRGLVE